MAMKSTFLFLNLAKIHIFIPKCTEGEGGGSSGLGNIPKKTILQVHNLRLKEMVNEIAQNEFDHLFGF